MIQYDLNFVVDEDDSKSDSESKNENDNKSKINEYIENLNKLSA